MDKKNPERRQIEFDIDKDFSFDVKEAQKHLNSKDAVSLIIRGLLYAEHSINETLKISMKRPELIELSQIGLPSRVTLCMALGSVPQWLGNLAIMLNATRNKIAHKLDYQITQEVEKQFMDEFPPEIRHGVLHSEDYKSMSNIGRSIAIVKQIVMSLEFNRHSFKVRTESMAKAEQNLIEAVKNLRKSETSTADIQADA